MKQIFALRLKELRKENKLTQGALSKILGIDIRLYQYYESANSPVKPTYQNLINIAQYYNISVDYLLGISNDKVILKNEGAVSIRGRRNSKRRETI